MTTAIDSTKRISVTAVTGFLGSGKTRFINQLLRQPDMANTVVIVNEMGQLGIDQASWSFVQPATILLEGGCLCCQMQGSMSATLQRLFTDALARKIPRFNRIIVETSGLADPSALRFTLHHDFFLKERFFYNGCIGVVDALNADQQCAYVEWVRQLVQADLVVLSKLDSVPDEQVSDLRQRISAISDAPILSMSQYLADQSLLQTLSSTGSYFKTRLRGLGNASIGSLADATHAALEDRSITDMPNVAAASRQPSSTSLLRPVQTHSAINVVTLEWSEPLRRSAFNQALEAMLVKLGPALIRAKALMRFVDDAGLYLVNIVHAQRYPAERLRQAHLQDAMGMVVFLEGATDAALWPKAEDFYQA